MPLDSRVSQIKHLFFQAGLKKWVIVWLLTTLLLFVIEICLSYSIQQLIALLMGQQDKILMLGFVSTHALPPIFVISLFSMVLLRAICLLGSVYSQEGMREKTALYFRHRWAQAALSANLDEISQSQLTNLMVEAIPRAGHFFACFVYTFFQAFLAFLYFCACLAYGDYLFFIAILLFTLVAIVVRYVGTRSTQCGKEKAIWMSRLNEYLIRAKKNHKLIKLLCMEGYEIDLLEKQSNNYYRFSLKAIRYFSLASNLPNSLGYITVTIILVLATYLDYRANIIIFIYLLLRFSQAMGAAAGGYSLVRSFEASFLEACDYPQLNHQTSDRPATISCSGINEINIRIDQLTHPETHQPPLLEKFYINLKKGESLGIIGPSGCGKSTLLDSVLKLYQGVQGEILINGKSWQLAEFNARISYVSSDPYLIEGSIFDNLIYGNHQKDLHEHSWLLKALAVSQLADLIDSEKKLNSIIISDSHSGLSTGQKQRLSIARAIARKPDLIIFDEATSNLDAVTEQSLWGKIRNLLPNTIMIFVTHRLSLAKRATFLLDFENNSWTQ